MQIYNTPTKQIEKLEPIKSARVGVFTPCGPTVYDYARCRALFNYVRMDTLISHA